MSVASRIVSVFVLACSLSACSKERVAEPVGVVVAPLVTPASWSVGGDQYRGEFGSALAGVGDVNGDGYDDTMIGHPWYFGGESYEGRAFLHLGSAVGLDTVPAWTVESNTPDAEIGLVVAGAGDVNGDGYADVLVTAADYDSMSPEGEGTVRLYLGSASGLSMTAAWTRRGSQENAYLGSVISSAGDVNGDGRSDVLVGSPYHDNPELDEGIVMLFLGTSTGLSSSPAWTDESNQLNGYFGLGLASGDFDDDGYSDFVVSDALHDRAIPTDYRIHLYRGSATGVVPTTWMVEDGTDYGWFGAAMATADVNRDGYQDLVVGGTGVGFGGRVVVYNGSATGLSTTPSFTYDSDQRASLGGSVASLGDTNGDGFADVIAGMIGYQNDQPVEGGAAVFFGSSSGLGNTPQVLEGNQNYAMFGRPVSGGDVDGDGFGDAIVGSPEYDNTAQDQGRVFVFQGAPRCPSGDTDGDGTPNCQDGCPNDRNKILPLACGCGNPEPASTGDVCPPGGQGGQGGQAGSGGGGMGGVAGGGSGGVGQGGMSAGVGGAGVSGGGPGNAGSGGAGTTGESGAGGDDGSGGDGGEAGADPGGTSGAGDAGGRAGTAGANAGGRAGRGGTGGSSGTDGKQPGGGSGDEEGCGCRVPGNASRLGHAGHALALLLALALAFRRRKRNCRG